MSNQAFDWNVELRRALKDYLWFCDEAKSIVGKCTVEELMPETLSACRSMLKSADLVLTKRVKRAMRELGMEV